jgi:hypothetical protein
MVPTIPLADQVHARMRFAAASTASFDGVAVHLIFALSLARLPNRLVMLLGDSNK